MWFEYVVVSVAAVMIPRPYASTAMWRLSRSPMVRAVHPIRARQQLPSWQRQWRAAMHVT